MQLGCNVARRHPSWLCNTEADIRSRSACLPLAGTCLTCPLEGYAAAPPPGTAQQVSLPAGLPCSMSHFALSCALSRHTPGECAAATRAHANRTHQCLWPQAGAPSLHASTHPAPAYSMWELQMPRMQPPSPRCVRRSLQWGCKRSGMQRLATVWPARRTALRSYTGQQPCWLTYFISGSSPARRAAGDQ